MRIAAFFCLSLSVMVLSCWYSLLNSGMDTYVIIMHIAAFLFCFCLSLSVMVLFGRYSLLNLVMDKQNIIMLIAAFFRFFSVSFCNGALWSVLSVKFRNRYS